MSEEYACGMCDRLVMWESGEEVTDPGSPFFGARRIKKDVVESPCRHSNGTVLESCPGCGYVVGMWGAGAAGSMDCECWEREGFYLSDDDQFERSDDYADLRELGGRWNQRRVNYHHGEPTARGRLIACIPGREWPNEPEQCEAGMFDTEWILDGRVLLCLGCGIDAT